MAKLDRELRDWEGQFKIRRIISTRVVSACKQPAIIVENNHYMYTGEDFEFELSYWLLLCVSALAGTPFLIAAGRAMLAKRQSRSGFPIIQ